MGRKRLLTILAGLAAGVALTAAPAAAQISLPGIGSVDLGSDGLKVDLDTGIPGVIELDPTIGVELGGSGPKLDIDGGAKVGGQELPVGEITQPVEDLVNRSSGGSKGGGSDSGGSGSGGSGSGGSGSGGSGSDGSGSGGSGSGGSGSGGSGSDGAGSGGGQDGGRDVQAAGNEPQVAELSPERERELEALAALREGFADGPRFGAPSTAPVAPGIIGPPAPGGLDPLAPEVADAPQGQVLSPGVPATEAPRVADDEPQEALLATSPLPRAAEDVPLLLKLLAGGLVLGSAAVWATAKQELQASRGTPTTA